MHGEQAACHPMYPSTPIPSPLDTLTHKNLPCGEGAATEQYAIEDHLHPEPSKSLRLHEEDLPEAGGVPSAMGDSPASPKGVNSFGFACMVGKADVEGVKCTDFDAHKQGGVLLVMGITPALAKGTVSIKPADKTEKAVAAKPEALVPWAQDKARHEVKMPRHDGRSSMRCHYRASTWSRQRHRKALPQKCKRCHGLPLFLPNLFLPILYLTPDRSFPIAYINYLWTVLAFSRDFHMLP